MTRIDDLPETVFVQVLSYLPARELVLTCRLVCSLWKSLVDKKILWIRKCQLEGLSRKHLQKQPKDWKEFYFLCHLRRNLIKNPCAEAGLDFWTLEKNRGDCWRTENLPGGYGQVFPDPEVTKYFVTSYGRGSELPRNCNLVNEDRGERASEHAQMDSAEPTRIKPLLSCFQLPKSHTFLLL
nr:PREDICTED: F-box only protein 6 isoform X2 [Latimeria chalumnae]|eukprot:XP_014348915.1 PREDICTED: F-box only protein 6 isoform X2 [Latimeria chalumnae]